jgi:hypothetical protein
MTDQLQVAIEALREIYNGCRVTGRWVDQLTYAGIDGDTPAEVPDGFFDADNEPNEDETEELPPYPAGTDEAYEDELRLIGGRWLSPARWEEYTAEEQVEWIDSCEETARAALESLGASLAKQEA